MPLVCKRYSPLPSIPTPQKADLVMSLRSSWPGFNHPHMNKHIKHIQMLISKYISLSKCLRKVTIYHHISLSYCVYIYISIDMYINISIYMHYLSISMPFKQRSPSPRSNAQLLCSKAVEVAPGICARREDEDQR